MNPFCEKKKKKGTNREVYDVLEIRIPVAFTCLVCAVSIDGETGGGLLFFSWEEAGMCWGFKK